MRENYAKSYGELQQDLENKINENENLINEVNNLKAEIENKDLIIQQLKRYLFGSKKETLPQKEENIVDGVQTTIFAEDETEEVQEEVKKETEKITYYRKKKNSVSGLKKSELKNVEQVEYIEEPEDLKCPECGSEMKKIGKEYVRQEIKYIPAKFQVINYYRNVYKCESCGTDESNKDTATIVKTHIPTALLMHSFVSPSLATEVIYQKYYMGVPLYRQEKVWDDRGLVLPRNVSSNWCIKISEYYLENIWKLMFSKLKQNCKLAHIDETTIQCNHEPNRKASSNSYMWVMVSGEDETCKGVIFRYSSSRAESVAKELLSGYSGIIVTDGYAGYNNIENTTHAECWAHARRYFYESIPSGNTNCSGYEACVQIDKLFEIEREISDLSNEEKLKIRQEKSAPILKNFYEWVYLTSQKYTTNKKLQKALTYAINQKKELSQFIENAQIPMTNSRAERAIRPFAVHRKNWLFADTVAGANANAVYYSLIEYAKLNNLNIYKYLNYLLDSLPQLENEQTEDELEKFLPWSDKLPDDIKNFDGEYEELKLS